MAIVFIFYVNYLQQYYYSVGKFRGKVQLTHGLNYHYKVQRFSDQFKGVYIKKLYILALFLMDHSLPSKVDLQSYSILLIVKK